MHVVFWVALTFVFGLVFTVFSVWAGYFVYRARRTRERMALRPSEPAAPADDPLDEYRRLTAEIGTSLGRANETARSMRDAVQKGVR